MFFAGLLVAVKQKSSFVWWASKATSVVEDNERDVERSDPPQPDPESDAEAPGKDPAVLQWWSWDSLESLDSLKDFLWL